MTTHGFDVEDLDGPWGLPRRERFAPQFFEERAVADPDKLCVVQTGLAATYGQVQQWTNRLAWLLRDRGAGAERIVAICLPQSVDYVVAVVGVLKSGAAYLPLDPGLPPARIAHVLRDADAMLVITTARIAERIGSAGTPALTLDAISLDEPPAAGDQPPDVRPENLAYVIYTSGSTGQPKGVMIEHRSLANLVDWNRAYFGLGPDDRTTLIVSPGFDVSVWEIWPTLAAGATFCVPDEETRLSATGLLDWLQATGITVSFLPTPLAELVLALPQAAALSSLRILQTGGDRLHVRPAPEQPFLLVNVYGPAENTVVATTGPVEASGDGLPSIGRPAASTDVRILDGQLHLVGLGRAGELYVSGPGVARGYLARPDLTAERFIPDPYATSPGGRLYRTGDLARQLRSGDIDFLGRVDHQVKVRGNRVEPGEVVAVLSGHPQVAAAHVASWPGVGSAGGPDTRLVAYIVPSDRRRLPSATELRRYLEELLPSYMVPATFLILDSLPLNPSGKIDRKTLPVPDLDRVPGSAEYTQPETDIEARLCQVWQEVFGRPRIGTADSFFELGGHSLLAVQIIGRIKDSVGADLTVQDVFANPTVAGLARVLSDCRTGADPSPQAPALKSAGGSTGPLSLPQEQVWFLNQLSPGNLAYHFQTTIRVIGPLDLTALERALTEITRRHEILRTTFEEVEDEPRQVVNAPQPYVLPRIDLSGLPAMSRESELDDLVEREVRRPFDLARLPLSRWTAVCLGPVEHELILVEHHMVHDGWSLSVLMREVEILYNAFASGQAPTLPELPLQFGDYARWQRESLSSAALRAQLEHWCELLADAPTTLSLPSRPRPPVQQFRGDLLKVELPPRLATRLGVFCREHQVSLFMAMYAAFTVLLYRSTGQTDICVGSGFANRRKRETENLIGMVVNTVVLRSRLGPDLTFRSLVDHSREVVLDAAANQEYPFHLVVAAMGVERDRSRNPLVQVFFSAHDSAVRNPQLGEATSTVLERGNGSAKTDLNVIVVPRTRRELGEREQTDTRIGLLWEYSTDLFDRDTMRDMANAYLRLLERAVDEPMARLADLLR